MSATNLIREAAKSGVWVSLDGGKLALMAKAKPPDELIAKLKANFDKRRALSARLANTDAEWLAAVADADRLGYPPREVAQ